MFYSKQQAIDVIFLPFCFSLSTSNPLLFLLCFCLYLIWNLFNLIFNKEINTFFLQDGEERKLFICMKIAVILQHLMYLYGIIVISLSIFRKEIYFTPNKKRSIN